MGIIVYGSNSCGKRTLGQALKLNDNLMRLFMWNV